MIFLSGSRLILFTSCSRDQDSRRARLYSIILSAILLAVTSIGQGLLLFLFITPLLYQSQLIRNIQPESVTEAHERSSVRIISLVKRCSILTILCLLTDIVAAAVTISVNLEIGQLIYDFNILVNAFGCIMSFQNSKEMLFPMLPKKSFSTFKFQWYKSCNITNFPIL